VAGSVHVFVHMLVVIVDTVIIVGVLSAIGYLLVFGRSLASPSKRFTDREARRAAAAERGPATFALRDRDRPDDEGPQTD
jgi:hypothetical protein